MQIHMCVNSTYMYLYMYGRLNVSLLYLMEQRKKDTNLCPTLYFNKFSKSPIETTSFLSID